MAGLINAIENEIGSAGRGANIAEDLDKLFEKDRCFAGLAFVVKLLSQLGNPCWLGEMLPHKMSENIGYGFWTAGTEEMVGHSRVGAATENVIHDGGAVNISNGTEGIVYEEFLHQMGLPTPDCKQKRQETALR